MSTEIDKEILEELKEQTKWLRVLSISKLKDIMKEFLATKEQKRIYELSDGKNSTRDIAKKLLAEGIKVSHQTVANYWKKWSSVGLVVPSEKYTGRFEKVINLKDLEDE